MRRKLEITITHLYPDHMNIYGDLGNVIALYKRCEWRGISVKVEKVGLKGRLPKETDIYFMGGGQDEDQITVFRDLLSKKDDLTEQIEKDVSFLAICGAFQLLGKYFLTGEGKVIEGIGTLDIETRAPDTKVKSRCIGNVVASLNSEIFITERMQLDTIVGFENHSGQTFLGKDVQPLAFILKGFGNNMKDKTEGCVYRNVIGTYLHGSFLPKNPHIADLIILNALERKYEGKFNFDELDDKEEVLAHKDLLQRFNVL
ncbi:glutamine amidotransferase [Candidatus Dojkabacteria bacterium]|nr:glutamine amidotransferase [Candidatus Dojkabacteria bacterium]